MRIAMMCAAAGIAAALGAGPALAMPGAIVEPALDAGPAPQLELVRGGCGFGEHRGWYGRCHYNRGWRGAARYRANHRRWRHYYY